MAEDTTGAADFGSPAEGGYMKTGQEKTALRLKKRTARTAVRVLLITLCLLLAGCGSPSAFEGTRTKSESGFWMEYSVLDREETADLTMAEGEELEVRIHHTAGDVDVTVGRVGEEPVYQGSGQTNAEFAVTIPKAGTYRISVTGHRAKGSVFFNRTAGAAE